MNTHPHDEPPPLNPTPNAPPRDPAPADITDVSVRCMACGYNLTGVAIGGRCPECGHAVAPSFNRVNLPTSGLAITSMVLGICSIPACVCTLFPFMSFPPFILGVLAIIFSIPAYRQVKRGQCSAGSSGLATAGLVCGIIGTLPGIFIFMMFVVSWLAEMFNF